MSKAKTMFDVLGRNYQSIVYAVSSLGSPWSANSSTSNTCSDPAGNTLKDKPAGSSASMQARL